MVHAFRHPARGLTLVEVIVVVMIIVVLAALLLPALARTKNNARLATARAQMQSLQSALEAYHTDHSMYPPSHLPTASTYGPINPNEGSLLLAQGLMGYFLKGQDGAGLTAVTDTPTEDNPLFGFRTRAGNMGGKVFGPYVTPNDASYVRADPSRKEFFIDAWKHDIIYYRGRGLPAPGGSSKVFATEASGNPSAFFAEDNLLVQQPISTGAKADPLDPNTSAGKPKDATYMKAIYPNTSAAGGSENNYTGGPIMGADSYIVISAGPDEEYFTPDDLVVSKP
jgi:prepilin-type N-terminal cleavage/methylation domain-containing protein